MKDLELSISDHDLVIKNYDLQLIDEKDAVRQQIKVRLWFFYGEWFLDTTYGVKYFEIIFVKNPNLDTIASVIKSTIIETPYVNKLLEYHQEYISTERKLNVSFKVDTIYGIVEQIGSTVIL